LERDSLIFSNLHDEDSLIQNEYCFSDSSCCEELDSSSEFVSLENPSKEENGIILEFETQAHSSVCLGSVLSKSKPLILSDTGSIVKLNDIAQREESVELHSVEPVGPTMATRSLSAVRRKQSGPEADQELSQDVIDAVSAENRKLGDLTTETKPRTKNNHDVYNTEMVPSVSVDELIGHESLRPSPESKQQSTSETVPPTELNREPPSTPLKPSATKTSPNGQLQAKRYCLIYITFA